MTRTYQCFLSDDEHPILRHSRTPSPMYESPLSSPALAALDEALTAIHELPGETLDEEDEDWAAELEADVEEEDEEADEDEEDEEEEWDECMRRRMMFLQHCRQDADRQPQFDGYRSISATLADVLRSVGCDEPEADTAVPRTPSASSREATMSAENLALVNHPLATPGTPSLTSASTSEESEADTLVNAEQIAIALHHSAHVSPIIKPAVSVPLDMPVATPPVAAAITTPS